MIVGFIFGVFIGALVMMIGMTLLFSWKWEMNDDNKRYNDKRKLSGYSGRTTKTANDKSDSFDTED